MDFPKLNLPQVIFKTKLVNGTTQVFDEVRKRYIIITPEEWVRQHFIHYLSSVKNYPFGLMAVEKLIKYNNVRNRADIVLYDTEGFPTMIVECKAPSIDLNGNVLNQALNYNIIYDCPFVILTNGIIHKTFDVDQNSIQVIKYFPNYN